MPQVPNLIGQQAQLQQLTQPQPNPMMTTLMNAALQNQARQQQFGMQQQRDERNFEQTRQLNQEAHGRRQETTLEERKYKEGQERVKLERSKSDKAAESLLNSLEKAATIASQTGNEADVKKAFSLFNYIATGPIDFLLENGTFDRSEIAELAWARMVNMPTAPEFRERKEAEMRNQLALLDSDLAQKLVNKTAEIDAVAKSNVFLNPTVTKARLQKTKEDMADFVGKERAKEAIKQTSTTKEAERAFTPAFLEFARSYDDVMNSMEEGKIETTEDLIRALNDPDSRASRLGTMNSTSRVKMFKDYISFGTENERAARKAMMNTVQNIISGNKEVSKKKLIALRDNLKKGIMPSTSGDIILNDNNTDPSFFVLALWMMKEGKMPFPGEETKGKKKTKKEEESSTEEPDIRTGSISPETIKLEIDPLIKAFNSISTARGAVINKVAEAYEKSKDAYKRSLGMEDE